MNRYIEFCFKWEGNWGDKLEGHKIKRIPFLKGQKQEHMDMIQKGKFRAEGEVSRAGKKGRCSISEGGGVSQFPSEQKE